MRKLLITLIIGAALLLSTGFSGKSAAPVEGIYPLKLKTLTIFDLGSGDIPMYGKTAELTDSKPDFIDVEGIDYEKAANFKFGSFRLGNNEKEVWFLMTQNSTGYWDNFYLDQNSDQKITRKEALKSFESSQYTKSGYKIFRSSTMIPVSVQISYKGITREYEQNLYFFISTVVESKKNEYHVAAIAFSASFLEGEMRIAANNEQRLYKFSIIDGDSNGCFNDYGKDLLFINLKQDGAFHKNESQKLTEFFDSTGNEKIKRQLRFDLLPFSLKMGVSEVTADFDLVQLEPLEKVEDETKDDNTQNTEPKDAPDQQEPAQSESEH